jgi:hypothetical protein
MKTWYVTTVTNPTQLEERLQDLEDDSHVIFQVVSLSGQISIISYKE